MSFTEIKIEKTVEYHNAKNAIVKGVENIIKNIEKKERNIGRDTTKTIKKKLQNIKRDVIKNTKKKYQNITENIVENIRKKEERKVDINPCMKTSYVLNISV